MPQLANVTLTDEFAATVTFSPKSLIRDGGMFVDRAGGIAIGYPSLVFQNIAVPKNRLTKTRVRLNVPILENVVGSTSGGLTPAPQKAFDNGFDLVCFSHDRSTSDHRGHILQLLKEIVNSPQFEAMLVNQESMY